MLLHRRDGFCRLGLGDGLGALAAAWRLRGAGDHAAAELSLLPLLLPGVFLIPLLRQRADRVLSGPQPCPPAYRGHPGWAVLLTLPDLLGILNRTLNRKMTMQSFPF